MRTPQTYVLYRDGELIAVGKPRELTELLGYTTNHFYYFTSGKSKRWRAVPTTDTHSMDMFAKSHLDTMGSICARIVRATRGLCRYSKVGCDELGWCEPCYRAACKLEAEKNRRSRRRISDD